MVERSKGRMEFDVEGYKQDKIPSNDVPAEVRKRKEAKW